VQDNTLISLAEAARRCPARPHPSAIWRWCRRGIKARNGETIRLEHRRIGRRVFVRPDDMDRFYVKLAEADAEHWDCAPAPAHEAPAKAPSPKARESAIAAAEAALDRAGA